VTTSWLVKKRYMQSVKIDMFS